MFAVARYGRMSALRRTQRARYSLASRTRAALSASAGRGNRAAKPPAFCSSSVRQSTAGRLAPMPRGSQLTTSKRANASSAPGGAVRRNSNPDTPGPPGLTNIEPIRRGLVLRRPPDDRQVDRRAVRVGVVARHAGGGAVEAAAKPGRQVPQARLWCFSPVVGPAAAVLAVGGEVDDHCGTSASANATITRRRGWKWIDETSRSAPDRGRVRAGHRPTSREPKPIRRIPYAVAPQQPRLKKRFDSADILILRTFGRP